MQAEAKLCEELEQNRQTKDFNEAEEMRRTFQREADKEDMKE